MANIFTVASKEFSDIVRSKRFIVLVVVFGLVVTAGITSVYVTVMRSIQMPGGIVMPQGFLGIAAFTLINMMSNFAPIMGLALGCDSISGERERGTLKITLAQPVFRDTVLNGKFVAALLAISLATLIASLANVGVSVVALGVTPTAEDIVRLAVFLLASILFAMTYYGIAAFLSTVTTKTTQSVIIGVVLWGVFTFVIPIAAYLVAFTLMPISFQPGQSPSQEEMQRLTEELRKSTAISETITSITPNYHFGKIAQYVLQAYSNTYTSGQAGIRTLSIMESLVFAWPNILVLLLATVFAFIAAYAVFTRQDIS